MKNSFCTLPLSIAGALLLTVTGLGQALPTNPMNPSNPSMTSKSLDSEKENLYAQFYDYRKNPNPEQQRFAYPYGKEYLRRFGGIDDDETRDVKKFVTAYEAAIHEHDLFTAYDAKNYAKVFEQGRPILEADPQNFFVLSILTEAGYDNSLTGNASLNAETTDYARRAIQLLEGGNVAKADPFKNLEFARGFLNFALGSLIKDEKPSEAAAAFLKAVKSDSPYKTDPVAYHRMGVAILKGDFAQLSSEYNEKFGNKPPSAEQAAMWDRIQHLIERTIDAYARAVALSTKPEQQDAKNKIMAQLTALYKNFHNNSDAGLNEMINNVLSKPLP